VQLRGEVEDPTRPGEGRRRQGSCHHRRRTTGGHGQGARGNLGQETIKQQYVEQITECVPRVHLRIRLTERWWVFRERNMAAMSNEFLNGRQHDV
jgi:hypothetical protein